MSKNIVTIGGSYGIGRAIAQAELAKGNRVTIASRSMDEALTGAEHIAYDAKEPIDASLFPDTIDGLVYCPGSINLRPFTGLKAEAFREDMEINFFSMVECIRGLMKNLKGAEQGSIVLFSTVAVQTGMPYHTSVAAAKGAIEGFARALAAELAPKIRVNVIAPSLTDTPLAGKLLANDKLREARASSHPLDRVGTPDDIAAMASFLLNSESSWMTGQVMHVDGGMGVIRR